MRQLASSAEDLLNGYEIRWEDAKAEENVSHVVSAKNMCEKQSHKVDKQSNLLRKMDDSIGAIDVELLVLHGSRTNISDIGNDYGDGKDDDDNKTPERSNTRKRQYEEGWEDHSSI
jgi:hypothetical protein